MFKLKNLLTNSLHSHI